MGLYFLGHRDTIFTCVYDEPFAAQEADERRIKFPGELDGQARWGRNTGYDREPGDQGFWDDFKTSPAAHEQ